MNNFLTYSFDCLGSRRHLTAPGCLALTHPKVVRGAGWLQVLLAAGAVAGAGYYALRRGSLEADAIRMDALSSAIIRIAFWSVLLIGVADAVLSFLRVEDLHTVMFDKDLATKIGLSSWRGCIFICL